MGKRRVAFVVCLLMCHIPALQASQVLFTPALVISEQYTDNLFLDYQEEVYDFTTSAGLELAGQFLWRTAGIELTYHPTYNSLQENNYLSYWRHEASLNSWKEVGRNTRLTLRDTYLRTGRPNDQSVDLVQNGQFQGPTIAADLNRRGRNEYYTNVTDARVNHEFGASERVYVAYQYSFIREVDRIPGAIRGDNDMSTPSMGLAYYFTQRWGVELDSSYAMTDYKERNDRSELNGNLRLLYRLGRSFSGFVNYRHTELAFDQDLDEDYSVYEPSVGIRYDFPDQARIQIGAGYFIQDFETSDNEEGFIVISNIYKMWMLQTGFFRLTGGSGYVIDDNGVQDNNLNIYYQGRADIGHHFSRALTGTIYGGYRHDEYPDETPKRTQEVMTVGLALDWQALDWMFLRLSYDFADLSTEETINEYTENRAMLSVRMAPGNPFRMN